MTHRMMKTQVGLLYLGAATTFVTADDEIELDTALDLAVSELCEGATSLEQAWNEVIELRVEIGAAEPCPDATHLAVAKSFCAGRPSLFALAMSEDEATERLHGLLEIEAGRLFPHDTRYLDRVRCAQSIEERAALVGAKVLEARLPEIEPRLNLAY